MVNHPFDQFFNGNYVKCIVSFQSKTCYSIPGSSLLLVFNFVSSGVCANTNPIVITPKEQNGAQSCGYSAGTVPWNRSFTKPGFKNEIAPEQTITKWKSQKFNLGLEWPQSEVYVIFWVQFSSVNL